MPRLPSALLAVTWLALALPAPAEAARSHADGVAGLRLEAITVPTFILAHAEDACDITPAADTTMLQKRLTRARKVEAKVLTGGSPAQSGPCEARSAHGFFGIEDQAVAAIAGFIKANLR
jgi:pimeloyl-ACP methyl ester carboxylesterase